MQVSDQLIRILDFKMILMLANMIRINQTKFGATIIPGSASLIYYVQTLSDNTFFCIF